MLWLCDLTDSNDEQEVIRTFAVLWERVKKRLEQTDIPKDVLNNAIQLIDQQYKTEIQTEPPYGVCFCQKEDISSQWTEYGDHTKGLSLGFDINWFILNNIKEVGAVVDRPKALGDIRGVTYIYGMFYRFGLIDMPDKVNGKMKRAGRQM